VPDLNFQVESAEPLPYAEAPLLNFRLRVSNQPADEPVHSIMLRCQIMIEAAQRRYSAREQAQLLDLFGVPEQWSQSLRSTLWTNVSMIVPSFTGSAACDLQVPCTFDFNIAAAKYFAGLESGEVPLNLLFSGTVFYQNKHGALQVGQISWEKEARYRLPVSVWKQMMDIYYPNTAWLCLRRDAFERLYQYKIRHGIPTWEQTLERLIPNIEAEEVEDLKESGDEPPEHKPSGTKQTIH
jgi:hypothetical protein